MRKVLAIWLAKERKQLDCNSQKHSDQCYCFLSVYKLHVPCKTHEPLFAHVWSSMHLYVICCFSRCAMRGLTTSCVEWTGYYRHIRCMIYFYRLMSVMSLVIDGSMIAIGYLITYNDIDLQENIDFAAWSSLPSNSWASCFNSVSQHAFLEKSLLHSIPIF